MVDSPVKVNDICGHEWFVYGCCCYQHDVVPHIEHNDKRIIESAMHLVDWYHGYGGLLTLVYATLKKLSLADEHARRDDWNINIKFAKRFLADSKNLDFIDQMKDIGSPERTRKYREDMQK